ncbi:hypothetical protein [Aquisphaera insulae]|uniref:hypothetical protein n=1 Tax=Aquisphaera insulae TaxID=2712864 RepID=UPI0013EE2C14|nr:hypothetical protein [Aquisphaera insulae]
MKITLELRNRLVAAAVVGLLAASPRGLASPDAPGDVLERNAQPGLEGRLGGDVGTGLTFQPAGEKTSISLTAGATVRFPRSVSAPSQIPPLFRVILGESGRLSGMIRQVGGSAIGLVVPWQAEEVRVARPGVQAVLQRPGEARVLSESFEQIDPKQWEVQGKPELRTEAEGRGLWLPPAGASLRHKLREPLIAGRLDVAFRDDTVVAPGRRQAVELTFRGPDGPATIGVVLGWSEDSLAVESSDGPTLAVQRLARTKKWRRLSVRFGPDQTELSVDDRELAHGKGPAGPLEAIALQTSREAGDRGGAEPSGLISGVRLVRFAEPPASLEIDPSQDEVRLIVGDQLYGVIRGADADRVEISVDETAVGVDWAEISGLFFRRQPVASRPVEGLLARVEWVPLTGEPEPARDVDYAEGAIVALDERSVTLETPYAGRLVIPRGRLTRLRLFDRAWRMVVDPAAHHLGDNISTSPPLLDPPLPEGGLLVREFELAAGLPLNRPAFVVMDVVQVVGETVGGDFSANVAKGELRTFVELNGKRVDYINHHVVTTNELPERIRIPLPPGLLRAGKNELRLVQTGTASDPGSFDDMGLLQLAIELDSPTTRTPATPAAGLPPKKP